MPLIAGFGVLIHTKSRRTLIINYFMKKALLRIRAEQGFLI